MNNLAQYRLSMAVFSLGLLWVASEVVGDGDKPGPLDSATKAIVHRLKSARHAEGVRTNSPYDLAVSTTDPGDRAADGRNVGRSANAGAWAFGPDSVANDSASGIASPPTGPESDSAEIAPDVGVIYK